MLPLPMRCRVIKYRRTLIQPFASLTAVPAPVQYSYVLHCLRMALLSPACSEYRAEARISCSKIPSRSLEVLSLPTRLQLLSLSLRVRPAHLLYSLTPSRTPRGAVQGPDDARRGALGILVVTEGLREDCCQFVFHGHGKQSCEEATPNSHTARRPREFTPQSG